MNSELVYVGEIIDLENIPNADFICSATVICGKGGKWKGIVKKDQFKINDLCCVYLPDSLISPNESMKFMAASNWRVKMRRFRGAPSEVVIMPNLSYGLQAGTDVTSLCAVTRYLKPVPSNLQGKALGEFPVFIPKTDEPNWQASLELVHALAGKSFYITEKADGSSTTAYKYKGKFGVCSRNWELVPDEKVGYWEVAYKYQLQDKLPEGIALQWETCGPKIQSNPIGLNEIDGFAFSAYNIAENRFLVFSEFVSLCEMLGFPRCSILDIGNSFDTQGIEKLGEGTYKNGKEREGVVVRSVENLLGHKPISFKVINLNYET